MARSGAQVHHNTTDPESIVGLKYAKAVGVRLWKIILGNVIPVNVAPAGRQLRIAKYSWVEFFYGGSS